MTSLNFKPILFTLNLTNITQSVEFSEPLKLINPNKDVQVKAELAKGPEAFQGYIKS